jgi:hypothetical protein
MNHGDEEVHELALAAPKLVELAKLVLALPDMKRFNILLVDSYSNERARPFAKWFAEHGNHDVEARNEYGRYYDRCDKRITCKTCKKTENCKRKIKHEGDCSPIPDGFRRLEAPILIEPGEHWGGPLKREDK